VVRRNCSDGDGAIAKPLDDTCDGYGGYRSVARKPLSKNAPDTLQGAPVISNDRGGEFDSLADLHGRDVGSDFD
jgi:hypothetical protein